MARDVNDIVVLGFGAWSDVYALPTLGFGSSAVIPPVTPTHVPIFPADTAIGRSGIADSAISGGTDAALARLGIARGTIARKS